RAGRAASSLSVRTTTLIVGGVGAVGTSFHLSVAYPCTVVTRNEWELQEAAEAAAVLGGSVAATVVLNRTVLREHNARLDAYRSKSSARGRVILTGTTTPQEVSHEQDGQGRSHRL